MDTQGLIIIYVILIALTIVFAAMKKTSWWSLMGVVIMPIIFLFVIWDVLRSLSETGEGQAEGQTDAQAESHGHNQ